MLQELRVENLLLIERAELELAPGLNVLTGETGAGKTVLAHALDLLLGGRARSGIVRPGAGEAYVEGAFALSPELLARRSGGTLASGEHPPFGQHEGEHWELLAADAEEIVLARRVGADGRTRAYLNGRTVAVADLRAIGEALLSFYGQHEHRKLTLAAAQLEILDGFCGPAQVTRRAACAAAHREVRELSERLESLRELDGARERELDLLEHELAEIDAFAPQEGEQERLRGERERLRRLDALLAAAAGAAEALAGGQGYDGGSDAPGAMALAAGAAARLDPLAGVDPALDTLTERAHTLAIEAEISPASCATTASGWRGKRRARGRPAITPPVGCRQSKSASPRWSVCCASTAPLWPRCWSTLSAHASDASSWRERRRRSRRSEGACGAHGRRCRPA